MAERAPTPANVPKTYAELKRAVEAVVIAGRRDIEQAWLHTYHATGRLIVEHLLSNQARADYGAKVFVRLQSSNVYLCSCDQATHHRQRNERDDKQPIPCFT